MPSARARMAVAKPMRPKPAMPSVLPKSSTPVNASLAQAPPLTCRSAAGIRRARASISPRVSSATVTEFCDGVMLRTTPAALAAATSTLSSPTPARPMIRSLAARETSAAFTCVWLRTISARASAIRSARRSGDFHSSGSKATSKLARRASIAGPGMSSVTSTSVMGFSPVPGRK